jgi:hypothetical protein
MRYENTFNRLPPYAVKRTRTGEILLSERTFRILAEGYQHAGNLARELTMNALRQLLLQMDKGVRQTLLAEELNMGRDAPARFQMLIQGAGETDESYAFRLAKRAVAMELYPPTSSADPEATTDSEDLEPSDSGSEPGPSTGRVRAEGRPTLSGNPYEGDGSEEMSD